MPFAMSTGGGSTGGFKISVVDKNGIKNGEFSNVSHLKFETAKGGKPKHLLIAPSSKEECKMLQPQTEERHQQMAAFMSQDGRYAASS